MNVDKTKIGLVLPLSQIPQERQREVLTDAGASHLVPVKDWRKLFTGSVGTIRPGDTVWFAHLSGIPVKVAGDKLSLAAQASEFVHTLRGVSAVGIEAITGRKTSDLRQVRAMLADAEAVFRAGGPRRPPKGYNGPPGRKSTKPKGEEFERLKAIWTSEDYSTNEAALRAMRAEITLAAAYLWFGPSGRPAGPRRKSK